MPRHLFTPSSIPKDFALEAARGNIGGITAINKFGRNPDIDQAASATAVNLGRSVWDGGIAGAANWVEPTTARTHQIVSTDADDDTDGGGTNAGARTVEIFGLDSAYARQSETVTLNGTSNVATANTYTMVHRMVVRSAGATGYNEGDITATADTDGTVTAKITATFSQTLMAIYMIPAGETGYMTSWKAELHKAGGDATYADVFLMSKAFGEVWRIRDIDALSSDGGGHVQQPYNPYKTFQAKELIMVIANPSKDGQDMSAGFDLICAPA